MSHLFSKFRLRQLEFKNRIFVSPMCQYSSVNGFPTDWHLVHLGSRAVGGASLVMAEATAVSPEGRITPWDTGIWSDEHVVPFRRIAEFTKEQGSIAGIQLAHAGRKASTDAPWKGGKVLLPGQGGWIPVAPSPIAFGSRSPVPSELTHSEIQALHDSFLAAATRSLDAKFQVVEIHMAHGYLLHEFLSPLANHRNDEYGGSFENRIRFPLQVARSIRGMWPSEWPVFVRISATDWVEGGWDLAQSIEFSKALKTVGIDFVDCSSGGIVPNVEIPSVPGYQVPFAEAIRKEVGIATGAVGLIVSAHQAEEIITQEKADAVLLARAMLRDPYWPLHAAVSLKAPVSWPKQYERARPEEEE